MKRLAICFFVMSIFAPQLFAADVPSRVVASGGNNESTATGRRNTTRVAPVSSQNKEHNTVDTTASRTATRALPVANISRDVGASVNAARNVSARASVQAGNIHNSLESAFGNSGRNARVSAASINNNPMVRRAGLSLRPSTAEVGGRAIIGDTGVQTGSNIASEIRNISARAAIQAPTRESIAQAKEQMEQTAALNKSCQEQYNECMDQFCSVIDANQKRCSCSANLSRYTKVEEAVKKANTELNEVAQRIRYVGLSADEIRAIMNATEAEEALSSNKDTSETRSMLDDIEKLIKDPKSSASYASDTGFGLDLDLDFSSDDFADMFNLDFLTNNNSSSFSNLRGTELYNAAKKRCNTILTQCKEVGATSQQITGNYDLAIDKDCIAYEQGLTKMNETLVTNVRSANRMLQKARLAVMQNKNQYDAKGCVAALDTCMADDMVCGDNYYKCLDPTKRYIDENGEVVLGQNISDITAFMENYNNANINATTLATANGMSITRDQCSQNSDGMCNVKYLLTKIGTGQKVTDNGLCRAVLDKCQQFTYDANGNYKPFNDIVVNYVQRAMVNIKAAQQQIISDYASTCIVDIATCYNKQVSQVNTWASSASVNGIYNVMTGACRNVALTCAYAVFAADTDSCPTDNPQTCLHSVSEMFYQSLLCPDNSVYTQTLKSDAVPADQGKYVNDRCMCNSGYVVWNNSCMIECGANMEYNAYGTCVCSDGYTMNSTTNQCEEISSTTLSLTPQTQSYTLQDLEIEQQSP